jgi:Trp operon repressor
MSRFDNCVGLKIIKDGEGSDFERAIEAELTASAHDEAYHSIVEVIEDKTKEKRVRLLRPFLEHELRQRFKAQLLSLGLSDRTRFSRCIEALGENNIISKDVLNELDAYREELNGDMHELEQRPFADIQSLAADMMEFIYHRMVTS